MSKHTWTIGLVATAIISIVTLGSMQNVAAKESAEVKVIAKNDKAARSVALNNDKDASKESAEKIVIEVVADSTAPATATEEVSNEEIAGIPASKLVMANVEEAVNIRSEESEDSEIVGKFYKECGGSILEEGSGWTKLKTGSVTGWVRNDYLLKGSKAVELAKKVVEKTATSTTGCLRVRKEANVDAGVLGLLAEGDEIGVVEEQGEWVKVEYSDGEIGYVSAEFVTIADELGKGESMEKIKAKEEALAKAKAEAAKAAKASKKSSNAAAAPAQSAVVASNNGAVAGDVSDVVLLAALIQAEAGNQPYEGQVSVGSVVMNRLRTGRYGGSIYSVIYAKSQFGPAGSGQVAQICAAGPKASCLAAAQDAMNGVSYIGTATHFRNVRSGYQGIVIGNHVFW